MPLKEGVNHPLSAVISHCIIKIPSFKTVVQTTFRLSAFVDSHTHLPLIPKDQNIPYNPSQATQLRKINERSLRLRRSFPSYDRVDPVLEIRHLLVLAEEIYNDYAMR